MKEKKKKVVCHYEEQISIINWELELLGRKKNHISHIFPVLALMHQGYWILQMGLKNTDLSSPLRIQDKVYLSFASNLVLRVAVLPGELPCVYLLLY